MNWLKENWFFYIPAIMLLLALLDWPYGYYQILRFVILLSAAFIAFAAYVDRKIYLTIIFGIIAVLFNPIIPIHLEREIWQIIDVVVAMIFLFGSFKIDTGDNRKK